VSFLELQEEKIKGLADKPKPANPADFKKSRLLDCSGFFVFSEPSEDFGGFIVGFLMK
jgi:hypothetical protein